MPPSNLSKIDWIRNINEIYEEQCRSEQLEQAKK